MKFRTSASATRHTSTIRLSTSFGLRDIRRWVFTGPDLCRRVWLTKLLRFCQLTETTPSGIVIRPEFKAVSVLDQIIASRRRSFLLILVLAKLIPPLFLMRRLPRRRNILLFFVLPPLAEALVLTRLDYFPPIILPTHSVVCQMLNLRLLCTSRRMDYSRHLPLTVSILSGVGIIARRFD